MVCGNSFRDKEPRTEDTKIQRKNTKEDKGSKKEYKKLNLKGSRFTEAFEIFYLEFTLVLGVFGSWFF